MQTEITQTIIQGVPLLNEDEQRKMLELMESFLNQKRVEDDWVSLKNAIKANQINSEKSDLSFQHDHYIYGTEKS